MRRDHGLVDLGVLLVIGVSEEAVEAFVIGQVPDSGNLQPAERDMRVVQVDRRYAFGVRGEVGKRIAAAARDAHDAAVGLDGEALHIDHRVFPDLGIDQPFEGEGEGPASLRITASSMIRFACVAMGRGVLA